MRNLLTNLAERLPPVGALIVAFGVSFWVLPAISHSVFDVAAQVLAYAILACIVLKLASRRSLSERPQNPLPSEHAGNQKTVRVARMALIILAGLGWAYIGHRWHTSAGHSSDNSVDLSYGAAFVYWLATTAAIWFVVPFVAAPFIHRRPNDGRGV